jgi:hypothetical protein
MQGIKARMRSFDSNPGGFGLTRLHGAYLLRVFPSAFQENIGLIPQINLGGLIRHSLQYVVQK